MTCSFINITHPDLGKQLKPAREGAAVRGERTQTGDQLQTGDRVVLEEAARFADSTLTKVWRDESGNSGETTRIRKRALLRVQIEDVVASRQGLHHTDGDQVEPRRELSNETRWRFPTWISECCCALGCLRKMLR